ncbi:hypothetical protein BEH94_04530 [Candidatus Altiarchaeales archaeon WOR_SM1_SCG]|nr:hypothetical protein BEH94_04530 [Candidatus Altiarchaeales archaeon WOR_SM1_SCG]
MVLSESAIEIALISAALAFMSAMVTKIFLSEEGKAAKEKLKELQKDMKNAQKKGHVKKMQKLQGEMMTTMMESFRHQFKPMLITMGPFLLVFWWLKGNYEWMGTIVNLPITLPIIGSGLGWLGWYFLCILVISIPLNKLLKNY